MSIIQLKNVSLSYGERPIFNEITADFQPTQKIGIVGRNGAGKSTLLKVIAGKEQLDDGSISIDRNKRIAYMPQDVVLASNRPIFDEAFSVFQIFLDLESEAQAIEAKLESAPADAEELMERYVKLLDQLASFERNACEKKTETILLGLGFKKEQFEKPVSELSVGWKMRLVLAKLLLENADFYLFDEPTNHLDISAKEWFFDFLKNASFGYLLVSHDRYFLDKACNVILELSHGNGTMYYGNYSRYVVEKEERNRVLESAFNRQQKEITRKQATIDRFRASASKARMAQSMEKQLDKIERIELEPVEPTISIRFPEIRQPGKIVLTVSDVSYAFERQLFKHASCDIKRGSKVALVAPNGMGKTTLFNVITGKLPLQSGSVEFGHNVHPAFFEQDQTQALDGNSTIFDEIQDNTVGVDDGTIRAFLGNFLFSGEDVEKKIKVLSGGEKNRVAMVKVLLQNGNFLLLDEPTNHLDLFAKSVLLQALQAYPGTILFVSHDHAFIQDLATDILELTAQGLYYYPGKYEDFLADKAKHQQSGSSIEKKIEPKKTAVSMDSPQLKSFKKIENRIERLEKERNDLYVDMAHMAYDSPAYKQCSEKISALNQKLQEAMKERESLQS